MTASNFNLRGISPDVMSLLKREAKEKKVSINHLILQLIEQGIGYTTKGKRICHHELDHLAGTWSKAEGREFDKHTKIFEKIDEEVWS